MNYGLYLSAMGMMSQQVKQSVIANNLANAGTAGFKRDLAIAQARENAVNEDPRMAAYRLPVYRDQGGGVLTTGGVDLSQGQFKSTDKSTEMALNGKGFFTVRGDKGERLLTRNGTFLINSDGQLVTGNGRAVLDDSGQPISLNPALKVMVSAQGEISQGSGGAGGGVKLGLVDVSDSRQLVKQGDSLMSVANPQAIVAINPQTQVMQNQLEESNVDSIVEMVNMMEGGRIFESNAKMISYQDATLAQLNTIGRVA